MLGLPLLFLPSREFHSLFLLVFDWEGRSEFGGVGDSTLRSVCFSFQGHAIAIISLCAGGINRTYPVESCTTSVNNFKGIFEAADVKLHCFNVLSF